MKISTDAVKRITQASHAQLTPEEFENEAGDKVRVYFLEDLTLSFLVEKKLSFFGLSFTALAQDFTVLSSMELLVSLADESGEGSYSIEDPNTVKVIEDYLLWRANTLELTGL